MAPALQGDRRLRATLFEENFATTDRDLAVYFFYQIQRFLAAGGELSEATGEAALAFIRGVQPRNEMESALAMQMLTVHEAIMLHADRIKTAETLAQMEYAERAFNRLARTQIMQLEALKKLRGSGEQKVTVEHVHIYDGGQAAVGNVSGGGRQ